MRKNIVDKLQSFELFLGFTKLVTLRMDQIVTLTVFILEATKSSETTKTSDTKRINRLV